MLARIIEELGVETVGDLSRARVKAWRERCLAGGASNKTVNNRLAVLLAAISCAVESELIESNPLDGLRSLPVGPRHQRRKPRALAEFEIAKVLAAVAEMDAPTSSAPGPSCAEWLTAAEAAKLVGVEQQSVSRRARREGWTCGTAIRLGKSVRTVRAVDALGAFGGKERIPQEILVRVLLETGARWGELTLATWADVDTSAAVLTFRAETTKTDTERSLPLRRETCEALVAYRRTCAAVTGSMPAASSPVFLSWTGRPWKDPSTFRDTVLRPAYEKAGLLERDEKGKLRSRDGHALHVHTLRHTCCTRLLAAGVPVPIVQALLGHASPQMTLRVYSHLKAEACRSHLEAVRLPSSSAPVADATAGLLFRT